MATDPTLSTLIDLQQKYQPLMTGGMTLVTMTGEMTPVKMFQATYERDFAMPQTGNPRHVLRVMQGDPIIATLSEVSKAVLQTYGKTVWKGITGPEDSPIYTDYWLWVEPDFSQVLQMGLRYNFQIAKCTPFRCGGGDFSYGVSIKVVVIPPLPELPQS